MAKTAVEQLGDTLEALNNFQGGDIGDFIETQKPAFDEINLIPNDSMGQPPVMYLDFELRARWLLGQLYAAKDQEPGFVRFNVILAFENLSHKMFEEMGI